MVNIIVISHAVFKMDIVVNGSKNIFLCNMFWDQIVDVSLDRRFQLFHVSFCLLKQSLQNRIVYLFCHTDLSRVDIYNCLQIYHHIGKDLDIAGLVLSLYPDIRNCRILDLVCQFSCDRCSLFGNHFARHTTDHIFCQHTTFDTVFQSQFFIEFVTSYFCKIITSCIKEHTCDQTFRAVHCQRLARTDLFVQF